MFSSVHGNDSNRSRHAYLTLLILTAILLSVPGQARSAALGMMSDNAGDHISIFDADSDLVSTRIDSPPGHATGDCAISADQHLGLSSNSSNLISFIDLAVEAGSNESTARASGHVSISNLGVDMSLSPDEDFLVAAGGGAMAQPLSVVDVRKRSEVTVSSPFVDHTSVEFCDDGTLLITTTHGRHFSANPDNALYDAFLDESGHIHMTGGRMSSGAQPNNSACAPGSQAAVMLDREGGITSFLLPNMEVADQLATSGEVGVSAAFSADGHWLYVRTLNTVEAIAFDPDSGRMAQIWSREVPKSGTFYGMDQIAIHPRGGKLYVNGGNELLILDPIDGSRFGSIRAGDATGVCFASNSRGVEGSGTGAAVSVTTTSP